MAKTLLLAEKPDQAKTFYIPMLERATGEKFEKRDGYYESPNFYVSYFFGHLLENLEPDEYNEEYKVWKYEDLPIIPETITRKFKDNAQAQCQLICRLANESDVVICGTDPDREGQLIFDNLINYYKLKRPRMLRLWAPSLTDKDLDKAYSKMKELEDYKNLSAAAALRDESDWITGMNGTRIFCILTKARLSIGRVITPTLALIVKRDREVENFKESFFYQLRGNWGGHSFLYIDGKESKFEEENVIQAKSDAVKKQKFALLDFKEEERVENPKKPFSLPDLQKAANKAFGYKLDQILEFAQKLYTMKLITYPRTDSPYLPESDLAEYHALVREFATEEEKQHLVSSDVKPVCVKNTDSPHTALIITGEKPNMNSLSPELKNIYNLVLERFVAAFMQPRKYVEYNITISDSSEAGTFRGEFDGENKFVSKLIFDIDQGFRAYKGDDEEESEDKAGRTSIRLSSEMFEKELEEITDLLIDKKKRSKPKYHTPATLITAMQTCGRGVLNDKYKKILAERKGIGTPATQASFPEKLEKHGLIENVKGSYVSTAKGRELIDAVSEDMKTPELTAEWEMKLSLVESGDLSVDDYRKELRGFIQDLVDKNRGRVIKLTDTSKTGKETKFHCPKCGKKVMEFPKLYVCEDDTCGIKVFKKFFDVDLPAGAIKELFKNGCTSFIKGFMTQDNKACRKVLVFDNEFSVKAKTNRPSEFDCPKCGKGVLEYDTFYGCEDKDCGLRVFKTWFEVPIPAINVRELFEKRGTSFFSGFKKLDGTVYSARLVFDKEFKVKSVTGMDTDYKCPKCQGGVTEFSKGYSCIDKDGCGFVVFKEFFKVPIPTKNFDELFSSGRTSFIGFKTKDGEEYNAGLMFDEDFKLTRYYGCETEYECPKCKSAVTEYDNFYKCQDEEECKFVLFKKYFNTVIPENNIKELFENGVTSFFDGFIKKDAEDPSDTYSSRLKFDDDFKVVKVTDSYNIDEKCPCCEQSGFTVTGFNTACKNADCGFKVYHEISDRRLSEDELLSLIRKGKTGTLNGFHKVKDGKVYSAILKVNVELKKVEFEFVDKKAGKGKKEKVNG